MHKYVPCKQTAKRVLEIKWLVWLKLLKIELPRAFTYILLLNNHYVNRASFEQYILTGYSRILSDLEANDTSKALI